MPVQNTKLIRINGACVRGSSRTAQRPRPRGGLHVLGKAKVAKFQITAFVEQKVLGLEVTVQDVVGMEVLKHEDDTGEKLVLFGGGVGGVEVMRV